MATLDALRNIDELPLENRRAFLRLDLEVPLDRGRVVDDERLRTALATIERVVRGGARVIVGASLAEARGRTSSAPSLEPIAERLSELVKADVFLPEDAVGDAARKVVQDLRAGQICLLENLSAHPEEAANDEGFARKLARYADVYVNDSLRDCERARASVDALPRLVRERGMGPQLAAELTALARVIDQPERPFVTVLAGSAAADKFALLEALFERVDMIACAGTLGNTLLAARGTNMQRSVIDASLLARGRALLVRARDRGVKLLLPTDVVTAKSASASDATVASSTAVPDEAMALDVGPNTIEAFSTALSTAKTVLWCGPLGERKNPAFAAGTQELARRLAAQSEQTRVMVGDDTRAALASLGDDVLATIGFVSAGGRASLELIEGRRLPGVEALRGGGT